MITLSVTHHTTYLYRRPVVFGRHRMVLRPREGHDVRVVSMELQIAPAHRQLWSRDVFGNSVLIVDFTESADQLDVLSHFVVQRVPPLDQPDGSWGIVFPVQYDSLETQVASAYSTASYPDDVDALRAWLQAELPISLPTDAGRVIFSLCRLLHDRIKYVRRNEKGVQTPAQTLKLGTGSCRDMATLMMDLARCLGFATRFASGYLHCPASEAGRASTHAWAEVYLPDLGWRGFDPTLGEATSLKHVVAGVSNHPRGVMPISGMFTGVSSDYREMLVTVKTEAIESPVEN